jgi:ElaA protein
MSAFDGAVTVSWRWATFGELSTDALYAVLAARAEVFVVEQRCVYVDPDGLDRDALHLLGWDGEVLVAYLRVLPAGVRFPEAAIGRVLTAATHRGRGLGRAVVGEALRRLGAWPLALSAQAHLEGFYGSFGFVRTGAAYDEDGIPHVPMRRPAP